MFEATLRNRSQPELGTLTVTFPIPEADYEKTICELKKLQIGDAVAKDCFIEDIAASTNMSCCNFRQQRSDSACTPQMR